MTAKPSRLLRCPLPESFQHSKDYSSVAFAGGIPGEMQTVFVCSKDYPCKPDCERCRIESYLERIEPLLVALVESFDEAQNYVAFDAAAKPGNVNAQDLRRRMRDAKKAFLEGVEK